MSSTIERPPKLLDSLDRKVVQIEVLQIVLSLQVARVAKARFADVDGGDSSIRLAERVPRRLRGPAAGNEDLLAAAHWLVWPEEMKQRTLVKSGTWRILDDERARFQERWYLDFGEHTCRYRARIRCAAPHLGEMGLAAARRPGERQRPHRPRRPAVDEGDGLGIRSADQEILAAESRPVRQIENELPPAA